MKLDWEQLKKDMANHPIKHVVTEAVLPTERTGQGFPLFDYQREMIKAIQAKKLMPSNTVAISDILSGNLTIYDLARMLPYVSSPKTNVESYWLVRSFAKRPTFGNFRIAPNRKSSKKG